MTLEQLRNDVLGVKMLRLCFGSMLWSSLHSGLLILIHGVKSLPDVTSYDRYNFMKELKSNTFQNRDENQLYWAFTIKSTRNNSSNANNTCLY